MKKEYKVEAIKEQTFEYYTNNTKWFLMVTIPYTLQAFKPFF
tara:strand:+ start:1057 stop:1182 length:126 start_codon:yes stop_codon:yes gene_type:complete